MIEENYGSFTFWGIEPETGKTNSIVFFACYIVILVRSELAY